MKRIDILSITSSDHHAMKLESELQTDTENKTLTLAN